MSELEYDLIVVGGGPAGLTAGIYAVRRNLKTLVITKDVGGQVTLTHKIENYPGFIEITGSELAELFRQHAEALGVEIWMDEVIEVKKNGEKDFTVKTLYGMEYKAKAIILAIGGKHRMLNVPGEKELIGKGVSYCFTCDGPFFKDKVVAVVGGGDSAFRAVEYLSEIAKKVYLIHRRDKFRAEEALVERVKSLENVEFVLNSVVKEILGKEHVEGVRIENVKTREEKILKVDGIFIEIGNIIRQELIQHLRLKTNEKGEIIVDKRCQTSVPGVFAAGDCTDVPEKQIVIAAAMGAIAALSAYRYIKS